MGGPSEPRDERRQAQRRDPVPIPRDELRGHLADLDEACEALGNGDDPKAHRLVGDAVAWLQAVMFDHLPPGDDSAGHAA